MVTGHMRRTLRRELELPYFVCLPRDFDSEQATKWPLVVFLHGAGERGSDLELIKKQGLVKQIAAGQDFPFILVAPQCPQDWTWDRSLDELDALLAEIIHLYPVDQERIYLTGLSMGGFGTWHWASRRPRAFAALVPICGGAMPLLGFPEKVVELKEIPIWVFHGKDDPVVPVERSVELVEALQAAGSDVQFTQYEAVGHDAWTPAYSNPELFSWLLAQRNRDFSLGD